LESYHPYLQPQKVSRNPKIYCIHSSLPKNTKSHCGSLGPLEVKFCQKEHWEQVMNEEFTSLFENNMLELQSLLGDKRLVDYKINGYLN
jgi:hypothetical protein